MRIIDSKGKDVTYFGFHAPINHHAMKMADPNYKINPKFIGITKPRGKNFIPISFAMMHMGLWHDATLKDEEEFSHPYEWLSKVSDVKAEGRSVLVSFTIHIKN